MTLQEFIEKTKSDEALKVKVNAAIMEKVILPMAQEAGVELSDEELENVSGGFWAALGGLVAGGVISDLISGSGYSRRADSKR